MLSKTCSLQRVAKEGSHKVCINLLDNHFPKSSELHKIFNRNILKHSCIEKILEKCTTKESLLHHKLLLHLPLIARESLRIVTQNNLIDEANPDEYMGITGCIRKRHYAHKNYLKAENMQTVLLSQSIYGN